MATKKTESRSDTSTAVALIQKDIDYMKRQLDHIDVQVSTNYATKTDLQGIRVQVRAIITFITAVVLSLIGAFIVRSLK